MLEQLWEEQTAWRIALFTYGINHLLNIGSFIIKFPSNAMQRDLTSHSEISDDRIASTHGQVLPGCIGDQTGACFDNQVDFIVSEHILIQNFCFNFKNSSYPYRFARP